MRNFFRITGIIVALAIVALSWPAYRLHTEIDKARSEDPLVWEEDVADLEAKTAGRYPAGEAVVFVGSSSIRLWDSLEEDMAPVPALRHGFGGAKLNDVVHYAPRLVTAYRPRAVVVFAGTNDIQPGAVKPPEVLLERYRAFVDTVRAAEPGLPVYFIAITPSIMRWKVWDAAQETNRLIAEWSATQPALYVIDTGDALLGPDGKPDRDNYIFDGLHLSDRGYALWTRLIRPPLLDELGLEP